ncbi:VOC family protein [Chryseobacterium sp. ON_d1]|uniref:VOC family protein n=1 Tax=Chryseobacterium sp. ON_d1 TaxID=2583211 RepID=UPI0011589C9F|nr:VOC family protein [Chryseobacterium sp. ON_d1]
MRQNTYIPPNVISPFKQKISFLLRKKWIRELVLLPGTVTGKRFSNKTADYGVFKPSLISHLDQLSIYVQSIEDSRKWYSDLVGLSTSRITETEPHPFKEGYTIRCCYMSADEHEECLVLIEERNGQGEITIPSGMSFFHFAFEVSGNRLEDVKNFEKQAREKGYIPNYGTVTHNDKPPMGDGETGGNTAVYFYDPDWNNVEFCGTMDTIENYKRKK